VRSECPITGIPVFGTERGGWLRRCFVALGWAGTYHNPTMPAQAQSFAERVVIYLCAAEAAERDPRYHDDYRLARMALGYARQGHTDPWRYAFWMYFGRVPEKLIPVFVAADRQRAAAECDGAGGRKACRLVKPPRTSAVERFRRLGEPPAPEKKAA